MPQILVQVKSSSSLSPSLFFYKILSGTLFSVQNYRWILIKQKIAEKVNDSDFTEIDLIDPPWINVFV